MFRKLILAVVIVLVVVNISLAVQPTPGEWKGYGTGRWEDGAFSNMSFEFYIPINNQLPLSIDTDFAFTKERGLTFYFDRLVEITSYGSISGGLITEGTFDSPTKAHGTWSCRVEGFGGNVSGTWTALCTEPIIVHTITAIAGTGGTISPSNSVNVESGNDQRFIIQANPGYSVLDVKVDGTSVGAITEYTFKNVTFDHTIYAVFDHIITATAGTGGTILPSSSVNVEHGKDQKFIIQANPGYGVLDVKVDGVSVGVVNEYTFQNVTSNHTIDATFMEAYTITATTGEGGIISPSGATMVYHNQNQKFTIQPNAGSLIYDVKVDGVSVGAVTEYTFQNVTSNHTIYAIFGHTITVATSEGGTITPSGNLNLERGRDQKFTIKANAGILTLDVIIDGRSVGAVTDYTFQNVTSNHTIYAVFGHIITATAGEGGTITPSGTVKAEHGKDQKFSIQANTGYRVLDVKVDGISIGVVSEYTFKNVTVDHTIDATFKIAHTITATAGEGGTITPSGETKVDHEKDQKFTIQANDGFRILVVKVDGVPMGAISEYTFKNVTTDHTIDVAFIKVHIITATSNDCGTITPSGKVLVDHGGSISFNMTSSAGYRLIDVKIDGKSKGPLISYMFVFVTDDHTIEAIFDCPPAIVKGDINNDGKVNSGDAILALQISANLLIPTDNQRVAADMNNDGKIGADDAILIIRKSVGLAAPASFVESQHAVILQGVKVSLGEVNGVSSEQVNVPVKVDNNNSLAGGDICIVYDSSVLRAVDVSSDANMLLMWKVSEPGIIRIAFVGTDKLNSKTFATIKFDILVDSISPLEFRTLSLYRHDALPIDSKTENGKFISWAIAPEKSALLQNFPNPFNPNTWIPYQLKKDEEATIRIYSTNGELVRELALGYKPAGIYANRDRAAYWDGKDKFGMAIASGVYFYSIQAGEFSNVKKMVILR